MYKRSLVFWHFNQHVFIDEGVFNDTFNGIEITDVSLSL
jgi:hypothetical protein